MVVVVGDLVGFRGGIHIASMTALSLVIPNWVLEKMTFEATSLQTKRNLFPDKKKEASLLLLLLLAFDALSLALELPSVNSKVQRERWAGSGYMGVLPLTRSPRIVSGFHNKTNNPIELVDEDGDKDDVANQGSVPN
ncbi:hypothetical protein Q3G72_034206 [Acer saccharum]|nr:hypothetical protein Q3G72_034206 [Acer saccharum]